MKIKIITDTTSDLVIENAQKRGVTVLPIGIEIDGVFYKEGFDITTREFYDKFRASKSLPHTSQINEYAFIEVLEEYSNQGYFFCFLNISKHLSNTYFQAEAAIKQYPNEKIYLCDTQTTSVGLAMLVEYAVYLSEKKDMTAEMFISEIEEFKKKISVFAVISDLKYLKMGGRLSSSAAFIGSMLKINPLCTIDGKIKVVSKHMGTKRAYSEFAKVLSERNMNYPMYIGHTDCYDFMKEMLKAHEAAIMPDGRERFFDMGAAIGAHVGPGSVAIAFIKK